MINDEESNIDPTDFFLHRGGHEYEHQRARVYTNYDTASSRSRGLRDLVNAPFTIVGDDQFFQHLYEYHQGCGFLCIVLTQISYILTVLFTITFSTFLMTCVDWKGIHDKRKTDLYDAIWPMCRPDGGRNGLLTFAFSVFIIWWVIITVRSVFYILRIRKIHELWVGVLGLSGDVQWVTWQMVIDAFHERVDPTVDSHYIVNRIMRWDNYLIAMLTKDTFGWNAWSGVFTKVLEWNLETSISEALFRDDGILIKDVMNPYRKQEYVQRLQKSFYYYGILNIICMPFVFSALTVYFIYRYVSEYHKNPKAMGLYSFTPLAKWKLRDFNELPHVYTARLNRAHPTIIEYLGQFVNQSYNIVTKFVSFILGSTLLILVGVSFFYPDMIVSLFLTEKPIIFYAGVVGLLFAMVHNGTVEEPVVYEPEEKFDQLMKDLHGTPTSWNNMSTKQRYYEIRKLFRYKWIILLLEIVSVIYVPFIMLLWLPKRAEKIVNFFRENSIDVDKMGTICSCAKFDVHQPLMRATDDDDDDVCSVTSSMERKMSTSKMNFQETYRTWDPERFRLKGTTSQMLTQEYEERLRLLRLQREQRERQERIQRESMASHEEASPHPASTRSALTHDIRNQWRDSDDDLGQQGGQRWQEEHWGHSGEDARDARDGGLFTNVPFAASPARTLSSGRSVHSNASRIIEQMNLQQEATTNGHGQTQEEMARSVPFDLDLPFPLNLVEGNNSPH